MAAVTALGAVLRFYAFAKVHPNPYYDAAVRSMGESWHNFFFGAAEPAGGVSVDKMPFDLWLQVASVKLFGFDTVSLRLPEALAGTLAIPLLFDLVRRLFGSLAGFVGALALAVMPIAVLTARSDTMDSLMMLFVLGAGWCVVRAVSSPQRELRWVCLAAVSLGIAFEVKLFLALLVVPALVGLYLVGTAPGLRRRARNLLTAGAVFLVVALWWPLAVSLAPGKTQPYPLGSADGSVWNVLFVFNGVGRLSQTPGVYGYGSSHKIIDQGDRGLRRLFSDRPTDYRAFLGAELIAALLLGAFALAPWLGNRLRGRGSHGPRLQRAGAVFLGTWLLTGVAFFSATAVVLPRYLEAFTPAVAGVVGVGVAALARLLVRRSLVTVVGLALVGGASLTFLFLSHHPGSFAPSHTTQVVVIAALAALTGLVVAARVLGRRAGRADVLVPVIAGLASVAVLAPSFELTRSVSMSSAQDSGTPGRRADAATDRLGAFLRRRQGRAKYEVATYATGDASSLIVEDGRPVLFLANLGRRSLVPLSSFVDMVADGEVRSVILSPCAYTRRLPACGPTGTWTRRHGVDVSAMLGMRRRTVYAVGGSGIADLAD